MLIILARHGQTTANAENRFQGRLDFPLSALGKTQAQKLAACIAAYRPERLYTSDLSRSRETAKPVAEQLGLVPVSLPVFREFTFGALEGLTWHEIKELYPESYPHLKRDLRSVEIEGQEPLPAFRQRLQKGLEVLLQNQSTAALIGHGRYLNALTVEFLGLDFSGPWPFSFSSAAVTVLEQKDGRRRLLAFNEQCHLSGDNI